MKKLLFITLAVVLALSVGLMGCGGEQEEEEEEECPTSILGNAQGYPSDPLACPEYGGTLIVLHDSAPSNIGAFWMKAGGWDSPQGRPALEKLLGLNEDGEPVPQLATSWVEDSDAMTITFTLRQGVEFHDGTAFNASAAEWQLEYYRDYGQQAQLNTMTDAVVNSEYEIELQFSEWDPNMIRNFFGSPGLMVSPTHVMQTLADPDDAQWHPCGTGPFVFDHYTDDVELVYTKNTNYWQEDLPYLDGVEIHYIADSVTRILAFRNEDGHVMNQMSTTYALALQAEGYDVVTRLVHIKGVVPNSVDPPFDNRDIRDAMVLAFDTSEEVTEIFDGQWTPTNQCATYGQNGWNSSIVGYPYNLSAAQSLMEANGYNATHPLETTLHYSTSECTSYYTVWAEALEEAYFDIDLHFMTRGPFMGMSGSGWDGILEFQFSYNGFELLYDQSIMMGMSPDASRNVDIAFPQAYIDLYEDMLVETDPTTRENMYKTLNAMAIDTYNFAMPQFGYDLFSARQPYVHDWGYGVVASEYCPEYAWMDP